MVYSSESLLFYVVNEENISGQRLSWLIIGEHV